MTTKEKQGFGLYFLLAFGLAWLCQVGGCMALLQKQNAVLYQLALVATMLCPLLAVLLVQKVFLRQPTGIGWKVQGKRRYWLAAWFGPAVFTVLAAVLYFAVFPHRLDLSGAPHQEHENHLVRIAKLCYVLFSLFSIVAINE